MAISGIQNNLSRISSELEDKMPPEVMQLGMMMISGAGNPQQMMAMFRDISSKFQSAGGSLDAFQRDISDGEVGYNPAEINAGRAYDQLAKLEQGGGLALPS